MQLLAVGNWSRNMKYCGECGGMLTRQRVADRDRDICESCGIINYRNPRVIVGAILCWGNKVLMCRRSQHPALGSWSIPGGFLECGETLQQGAARETFEETGVVIKPDALQLYAVMNITAIDQVMVSFRVQLAEKPELRCGPECLDLGFMSEEEMPTSSLAWGEVMGDGPQRFFAELRSGHFSIHLMSIGMEGEPFHNSAYDLR